MRKSANLEHIQKHGDRRSYVRASELQSWLLHLLANVSFSNGSDYIVESQQDKMVRRPVRNRPLPLIALFICIALLGWRSLNATRRPFRFLEGSEITSLNLEGGNGTPLCTVVEYRLGEPISELAPHAKEELLTSGWQVMELDLNTHPADVAFIKNWPGDRDHAMHVTLYAEANGTSRIVTALPASIGDRLLEWFR